ncbi:hypothetical protein ACP4OV_011090 [Aristida adscensionis]
MASSSIPLPSSASRSGSGSGRLAAAPPLFAAHSARGAGDSYQLLHMHGCKHSLEPLQIFMGSFTEVIQGSMLHFFDRQRFSPGLFLRVMDGSGIHHVTHAAHHASYMLGVHLMASKHELNMLWLKLHDTW